jgi:hypothetical protein
MGNIYAHHRGLDVLEDTVVACGCPMMGYSGQSSGLSLTCPAERSAMGVTARLVQFLYSA